VFGNSASISVYSAPLLHNTVQSALVAQLSRVSYCLGAFKGAQTHPPGDTYVERDGKVSSSALIAYR